MSHYHFSKVEYCVDLHKLEVYRTYKPNMHNITVLTNSFQNAIFKGKSFICVVVVSEIGGTRG